MTAQHVSVSSWIMSWQLSMSVLAAGSCHDSSACQCQLSRQALAAAQARPGALVQSLAINWWFLRCWKCLVASYRLRNLLPTSLGENLLMLPHVISAGMCKFQWRYISSFRFHASYIVYILNFTECTLDFWNYMVLYATMHVQWSTETRKMGGCGHVTKDSK